jgi:hypothetical protein
MPFKMAIDCRGDTGLKTQENDWSPLTVTVPIALP